MRCAPKLIGELRKGDCGRIAVVGGSEDYSGAPYFASMAALKLGCDIARIFTESATSALPIKCYSPDLIVSFPYEKILSNKFSHHCVIIGPGLGNRTENEKKILTEIIAKCVELKQPLILDAEALELVPRVLNHLQGYRIAVLTPNEREFHKLCAQFHIQSKGADVQSLQKHAEQLASFLGGPVVLVKGREDIIVKPPCKGTSGCLEETNASPARTFRPVCPRRVGGQGDLLCGVIGGLLTWCNIRDFRMPQSLSQALSPKEDVSIDKKNFQVNSSYENSEDIHEDISGCVAHAVHVGCHIVRCAGAQAYEKCGRGMLSSNILENISFSNAQSY